MNLSKIKWSFSGIKETTRGEWIIRFIFGGLISTAAGLAGREWGIAVGGMLLAFPSIMPATLTLVLHHRGRRQTAECARGAVLGGIGLIAFGAVVFFTIRHLPLALSLGAGLGCWFLLSATLWSLLSTE